MKKNRGTGLVYQPTYVDKGTGERKAASTWWIQYSVRGRRFRESSGSRNRTEAEKLLQERLEAAAQGKPVGPRAGKARSRTLRGFCSTTTALTRGVVLSAWRTRWAICADISVASWRLRSRAIASGPT